MKTLHIHRLTPVLMLTLTVLFTACDSLTGIDASASDTTALDASTDLRAIQEPDVYSFATTDADLQARPVKADPEEMVETVHREGSVDLPEAMKVELSARVVKEDAHTRIIHLQARAGDGNRYYFRRQVEGRALETVDGFKGTLFSTVVDAFSKEDTVQWVDYWIENEARQVVSDRIRIEKANMISDS